MIRKNALYYGDNLDVLREHIADASVDLIYLDPPFNSNTGDKALSYLRGACQLARRPFYIVRSIPTGRRNDGPRKIRNLSP